ncbi:hypothetical protein CABS01_08914 [Colletotrichum abscissum]|uniref:uncharacterized protein n=1 Tax=Colletotrichum abscissum TaxID=1671311 RepID=UPI0027D64BDB|nr:uncharacterized protein CABS01_08914 [Colletotrichum abscissum]KAK1503525.1 hypothetical protein CABS01_08914 [Colletotrichum abscissum]
MDGALSAHRSREQPWLPRLMMPVDRLAAHPSPLNDPQASFVLLLRAYPQARCDATQGRHPPRPNSVTAGWNSLIKCGDVVAGEEEKGPRKKESKTREKKRSDDFDFFVSLPCAEHAASTSHQQQHCPLSRLSHLGLPPSFHVF